MSDIVSSRPAAEQAEQGTIAGSVPRAFEMPSFLLYLLFAAGASLICAQINIFLGITPNTAVIGVLVAIAVSRTVLPRFRAPERQVLVETATSAGGFAGANIALVSLATLYLLGLERLLFPLLVGITIGMVTDIFLGYRLFGTRAFPADGPWPDGEAVGRVIQAGDSGGRLAVEMAQGVGAAFLGRLFSLPMAGVGIAFIGNPVALSALAGGLVIRANAPLAGFDFSVSHLQHGMMIGAGLVQVLQTAWVFWKARQSTSERPRGSSEQATTGTSRERVLAPPPRQPMTSVSASEMGTHFVAFGLGAIIVAGLAGFWTSFSAAGLFSWLAFAAAAALVHTIIVGYAAMLSGWFPSFAVAIALMLLATLAGFPVEGLALLAGYVLSTGPQFADLGYDLKSGWIIRGRGENPAREAAGRRQQLYLQQLGAVVGIAVAALAFQVYWQLDLVPPMGRVMAATLSLAVSPAIWAELAAGAACGALLQTIGGPGRALGIMLATGLLLDNALYGYALAGALVIRAKIGTRSMAIRAPGLIAGDGIAGFLTALVRVFS